LPRRVVMMLTERLDHHRGGVAGHAFLYVGGGGGDAFKPLARAAGAGNDHSELIP